MKPMSGVGTLNEKSLHAQLKDWYRKPGDRLEVPLDGYVIDLVRGDLLVEFQTRNFSAMRTKLDRLTLDHAVRVVYPIAVTKWLNKLSDPPTKPRRSPKRGQVFDIFGEVVSLAHLVTRPNLCVEVVLIEEEEDRVFVEKRARRRRRGWVTHERRLVNVISTHVFGSADDYLDLLPALPDAFTTATISEAASVNRRSAQQAAYCLRKMGAISMVGKDGNSVVYQVTR